MAASIHIPGAQGGAATPLQADAAAPLLRTIDRSGRMPRDFLKWLAQAQRDAQVLDAMHTRQMRRNNRDPGRCGTTEDALWAGLCAVRQRIEEMVETLRAMGCLLHVGCALAKEVQHG